jgi:hypothetical protein
MDDRAANVAGASHEADRQQCGKCGPACTRGEEVQVGPPQRRRNRMGSLRLFNFKRAMILMPLLLPGVSGCSETVSDGGRWRGCGTRTRSALPA